MSKKKDKQKHKKTQRPYSHMAVTGTASGVLDMRSVGSLTAGVSKVADEAVSNALTKVKALGCHLLHVSSPSVVFVKPQVTVFADPAKQTQVTGTVAVATVTAVCWRYTDEPAVTPPPDDQLPEPIDNLLAYASDAGGKVEIKEVENAQSHSDGTVGAEQYNQAAVPPDSVVRG